MAPTLRSLLSEKTVFEGAIQVAIQGTAARVDDVDGGVTVMAGNGYGPASSWNGGLTAPSMRQEIVPILDWPSERAFERGIALALVGACGGRLTFVSSWEHLPPLVPSLFSGYGRPKLMFCHPATASRLFMAAMADPMRAWLTPASPRGSAQFSGAEVFPSVHFPEDSLVFVQDGNEVGRCFMRDAGLGQVVGRVVSLEEGGMVTVDTGAPYAPLSYIHYLLRPGHRPIRVGDALTVESVEGIDAPMRAGLLLNSTALACVKLLPPPPPLISRYTWIRFPPELGDGRLYDEWVGSPNRWQRMIRRE